MTKHVLSIGNAAPEDTAMELSCVVTIPVLRYLREKRGEREMARIISETGMSPAYLGDSNNWISYDYFCRLLRKLVETTGVERAPFDAAL